MIESGEEKISLKDAPAFVAREYGGRRPHVNTVARWCIQGLRGTRLESLKRGGHRVTTKEALHRFFRRISGDDGGVGPVPGTSPKPMLPSETAARLELVMQELTAKGF